MSVRALIGSWIVTFVVVVPLTLWGDFNSPAWWVTVGVLGGCIGWIGQDLADRGR